ncbi:MAG: DUF4388 domain-containing protein [Gemmatimonadetes bacterium]|nr:DUF4388 domain-containing protein [Gemmatimonadota bacterium]
MAIEGSLADISLADICQLLTMGRKTGCLTMTDRSNFGYIFFENGKVIYASLLNRPDRLGELLVKNEAITRDDLSAAMEQQGQREGKRLGEILVEMGSLAQEDLEKYISVQIEEAVYRLFTWAQGSFHFKPDEMPEEGFFLVSINPDALLMEGARRVDEWSLIEKRVSSMDLIFVLKRDPLTEEDLELTDAQRRVILLLDGERSVEDIVEESGLVEFDTAKALYGLILADFAESIGKKARPGDSGDAEKLAEHLRLGLAFYRSGMLEDSVGEFRKALQVDPQHPQARLRLAMLSLKAGRPQEAIVHFDGMPDDTAMTYGILRNRALALERLGRYDEALASLSQAGNLHPDDPALQLSVGIVLFKAGNGPAAVKAMEQYLEKLGSETPPPMFYAYAVLAAGLAGAFGQAVEFGREGLKNYPEEGAILVNTGAVLEHKGEEEAAQAYYERAAKSEKPPPQAYKAMGDQAFRRGDSKGARAHYEQAVKIDSRLGEDVYIKLGDIALEDSQHDEASTFWRRALELNPHNDELQEKLEQLGAQADG